jgi:hypothetical protein
MPKKNKPVKGRILFASVVYRKLRTMAIFSAQLKLPAAKGPYPIPEAPLVGKQNSEP